MNSELLFLYALVFPYIFLLFDCCELALIDCIVKCKVHSVLWQLQVGGVNRLSYMVGAEICEILTVVVIAVCLGGISEVFLG